MNKNKNLIFKKIKNKIKKLLRNIKTLITIFPQ